MNFTVSLARLMRLNEELMDDFQAINGNFRKGQI